MAETTIHDILAEFRDAALNNRDLGDKFERLICRYPELDLNTPVRFLTSSQLLLLQSCRSLSAKALIIHDPHHPDFSGRNKNLHLSRLNRGNLRLKSPSLNSSTLPLPVPQRHR
jgi:hypothetical protein